MGIYLTIFIYSVTNSVFFPVFQSLVFFKSCISLSNSTDTSHCASRESAAKDVRVHEFANYVLLYSSTGLCLIAFFTSRFIGHLSDVKSRKLAFLIPFTGLFISDLTVLLQVVWPTLSPWFFIVSEVIYGVFGGYMSITSGAFAIISSRYTDTKIRATAIARLEGTIAFGSTVGFIISAQLGRLDYFGMSLFFLAAHSVAFLSACLMKTEDLEDKTMKIKEIDENDNENAEMMPKNEKRNLKSKEFWSICKGTQIFEEKPSETRTNLKILYFSFACSYFAFIGSTRILFFYLKHKFYWGTEKYGYLKAINQGATSILSIFIYPFLKNQGISDIYLALFGLTTRSIGRGWYAVAWDDFSVFFVVFFEMFSKFPATALRSLISSNVGVHERGSAFSLVAVIEAFCNLTSAWVFHSAFPKSLTFFPELSFVIMPLCILPALLLMFTHRKSLKLSETRAENAEIVEISEKEEEIQQIPTETDTLTDNSTTNEVVIVKNDG